MTLPVAHNFCCVFMKNILIILLVQTPIVWMQRSELTQLNIPDRPKLAYVQLADINLGGLFSVSDSVNSVCGSKIRVPILQQMIEAVVFAVDKINRDTSLLPNVQLGFALLDDCGRESTAAAQALRFLPRLPVKKDPACQHNRKYNTYGQKLDEYYDVVGIIGPLRSTSSVVVSTVLGPARLPQVSFLSTSDELSRKNNHPFFLRVVPPDAYQMRAILKFISLNGWSYFSVLYLAGSYGEPAYESIKNMAQECGLCIAAHYKLYPDMTNESYRGIIRGLNKFTTAKVVLLVSGDNEMVNVFRAVREEQAIGRFIWIGSDGWADRVTSLDAGYRNSSFGSFTTTFYAPPAEEFYDYFRNLKPGSSKNPWFLEFWERMFNCSFNDHSCSESVTIDSSPDYVEISQAVYGIDAVYTYAHALHRLLEDNCPYAEGISARACVNGELLRGYLYDASFIGLTGPIKFNENGDRMGKYVIRQILPGTTIVQNEVVVIDVEKEFEIITLNDMSWEYTQPVEFDFGIGARFPRTRYYGAKKNTPISVCSRLCERGEQKIEREGSCCWDCRHCRENEKLIDNFTRCEECPNFHWPDEATNLTSCLQIDPVHPGTSSPVIAIIFCTSSAGIFSTIWVISTYVRHRNVRVIKAASLELSFLQLGAIVFGYFTMIIYTRRPTDLICGSSYFMFSLSFNGLYAPLLIKTIRIYRIFKYATQGRRALRMVSSYSQVLLTLLIILGQILICCLVTVLSRPKARLYSNSKTDKCVELYCDVTLPGFQCFIVYNLTLVCLCTVFAIKTRKLPDNFNESRFISMCVFTTLVIWLAIIPSFLTASREYLRSLLLAAALLLNHSVALIFLFISRIYAIYYVEDISTEHGLAGTNASVFQARSPNSVIPVNVTASSSNFLKPGPSF